MALKSFSQHARFWKLGNISWEYRSRTDNPQFFVGDIQSRAVFSPIVGERARAKIFDGSPGARNLLE